MRFLNPTQLAWALTALVPLVLYLLRRKPRKVPVSSLIFFKSLSRAYQESAWLRRLKRLLSLLLTLLVIAGAVGALAHLVVSPSVGEIKSVVVVVDRSASMAAKDADGTSRLAAAQNAVDTRLAGLPGGVAVTLIAFDRRAEIVAPKTFDRRVVQRALAGLSVRPVEGDPQSALRLAKQLAELEPPTLVWFASDASSENAGIGSTGPMPPAQPGQHAQPSQPDPSSAVALESLLVPMAAPRNVGITGFAIRRLPLESNRYEAFVELQAVGADTCETKLEVRIDGALTAVRSLSLAPNGRESLLLPIDANAGKFLSVMAITADDQLAADNEVKARIPDARPLKVLWISEKPDPFTQLALTALSREGELSVFRAGPEAWPPKEPMDAVIFQHWLPEVWPAQLPAIVIDPPKALGPVVSVPMDGRTVDRLRATRPGHPLLYGVATGRLALQQTVALAAEGALEPLWTGPAGPLLAAGDVSGQRVVVLGFAPEKSENLPLSASYPLLLGNAIYWITQPASEAFGARVQRTGDNVELRGQTLTWLRSDGSQGTVEPIRNGWAPLPQIGLWQTDAGDFGSAALLSSRETLLPAGTIDLSASNSRFQGEMKSWLLWLVLGVLLLESWLFHRYAVQ